jgi:hypothetical protein
MVRFGMALAAGALMLRFRLACYWPEHEVEGGALARLGLSEDPAAMPEDDPLDGGQADAGTFELGC